VPLRDKQKALDDINRVLGHKNQGNPTDIRTLREMVTLLRACIERWAPPGSKYRVEELPKDPRTKMLGTSINEVVHFQGALLALRADIDAGALTTYEELVHASVFSELLGDAEHLLDGGYLLAATVIVGATLEAHLRKVASKHGVATVTAAGKPVKAANINDQVAKASAYSAADHDLVSGWLRIRNEAAHNEPDFQKRTASEIRQMLGSTREFIARHPA